MIEMIAQRYSRKANFIGYSFREDMVAAAVMNLCNNALKFKPEKSSNPFSFYTTAIHNSFLQYMADEKKHRNIRDALLIDAGSNPSFNFMQGEKDEQHFEVKESDEVWVNERNIDPLQGLDDNPLKRDDEVIPATPREAKIGYLGRVPSAVVRYGPKDIIIDADGNITMRVKEPKAEVKKPTAKKAAAKKTAAAVVKTPVKKTTVVKATAKVTKTKVKEVVEKKAVKKPATKKTAAKKTSKSGK